MPGDCAEGTDKHGRFKKIVFSVPFFEPLPPSLRFRAISDRWLGTAYAVEIDLSTLALPLPDAAYSRVLRIQPLPTLALRNALLESYYAEHMNIQHFNRMQSQIFFPALPHG